MHFLKKLLGTLVAVLLVPVLLFEEWGWEPLAAAVAQLARLPLWARLEAAVRRLPPYAALLLFLLPVVMLLPLKLLALFLLGRGQAMSALLLLLGAKVIGTALVARLFQLVEPALMQIPVFARWYPRWKQWKNRLLARVRESPPWLAVRRSLICTRRWWRGLRRAS